MITLVETEILEKAVRQDRLNWESLIGQNPSERDYENVRTVSVHDLTCALHAAQDYRAALEASVSE